MGTVSPDKFEESLERIAFHFDEPFGDSSAIPTGYVSKFASNKVKMVLTGDGGDEVLSGYLGYKGLKFIEKYKTFPPYIRNIMAHNVDFISYFFNNSFRYKINKISNVLKTAELPFIERFVQKRAYTDLSSIEEITRPINNLIPIREFISDAMSKTKYKDEFYKYMYFNFKYDLPNDYLVKVDRMSMAYSLETRTPFLDYRLIEFMIDVHKDVKLQGWESKSVLRKTIGKKLPKNLLRAPKRGFGIPVREWFKDSSMDNALGNLDNLGSIFNANVIRNIISDNRFGKRDNGNFIWSLLVLNKLIN
jgi:asparagine synthase (glutamine-hydrolysing)